MGPLGTQKVCPVVERAKRAFALRDQDKLLSLTHARPGFEYPVLGHG